MFTHRDSLSTNNEIQPSGSNEETAPKRREKKRSFQALFFPRKGFIATPILIFINVLVFILMVASGVGFMSPDTLSLLKWGADFGPLTLTGDWWRTLTCNFVHIGAFHLLMNMYALLYVGFILELLIGTRRMFASYLLTGLCSSVFSLFMHAETISAGASGSVFGLYGVFLALLLFHRHAKALRKTLLTSMLVFVAYNLLYGMKEGIDNAAHIGGLISGFLLGLVYAGGFKSDKTSMQVRISVAGEIGVFCIFLSGFLMLCENIPQEYREIRKEWDSGLVEDYLKGELEDMEEDHSQNYSSPPQIPSYSPLKSNDSWLVFHNPETKFTCLYPTNWNNITDVQGIPTQSAPPMLRLVNGGNQLTVISIAYEEQEEFERMKKTLLTLPRNAEGKPSEDYKLSNIRVNGLPMTKITNPLHIGAPGGPREKMEQTVLFYFQENKKRVFSIVMLAKDQDAKNDLETIAESIRISSSGDEE